jgi:putative redox protein
VTSVRHLARAAASTSTAAPAYRVDVRAGAHDFAADEPATAGGGDEGPTPLALMLSALVACTAMTLRMYAGRKDWVPMTIDVTARYNVDEAGAATIERTITLSPGLSTSDRQRLADIAERTPVTLAIRGGTPITTTVQPRSA